MVVKTLKIVDLIGKLMLYSPLNAKRLRDQNAVFRVRRCPLRYLPRLHAIPIRC